MACPQMALLLPHGMPLNGPIIAPLYVLLDGPIIALWHAPKWPHYCPMVCAPKWPYCCPMVLPQMALLLPYSMCSEMPYYYSIACS